MTAWISGVFSSIFGQNSWLATMIISMIPIIEVKGAIPFGASVEFWGNNALSAGESFVWAVVGSSIIVPIIALLFRPIINAMKTSKGLNKIANVIEKKVSSGARKIKNNSENAYKKVLLKMLGVFVFVAIPLPMTGVWTGTCIGVYSGLKLWQTTLSVVVGNLVASVLLVTICSAFPSLVTYMFVIVMAIVVIYITVLILKILFSKKDKEEKINDSN
ncbi:MAG: hypothetical protein E7356_02285 [Clostridiales bacterium]|nr:hypothetical protein [Clostridiales bacterium]